MPREILEFYKMVLDILLVGGMFYILWCGLALMFARRTITYRKDGF